MSRGPGVDTEEVLIGVIAGDVDVVPQVAGENRLERLAVAAPLSGEDAANGQILDCPVKCCASLVEVFFIIGDLVQAGSRSSKSAVVVGEVPGVDDAVLFDVVFQVSAVKEDFFKESDQTLCSVLVRAVTSGHVQFSCNPGSRSIGCNVLLIAVGVADIGVLPPDAASEMVIFEL